MNKFVYLFIILFYFIFDFFPSNEGFFNKYLRGHCKRLQIYSIKTIMFKS